jgi:glyoxylase-like metal-dependent hydrolase (beta-lactamase superfamily II)
MEIVEITEGVFLHTSYMQTESWGFVASNGLIKIKNGDAYIIDFPWPSSDTEKLVQWINDSGYNLKASISTHFHDDRASGIGYLNSQQIPTYASARTNALLELARKPTATVAFSEADYSVLEGVIEAFYPGAGHTEDNLVVWLPEEQILIGGCLVKSAESRNLGNLEDASVEDYPATLQKVMERYPQADTVVPGHGALGALELLRHTLGMAEIESGG